MEQRWLINVSEEEEEGLYDFPFSNFLKQVDGKNW